MSGPILIQKSSFPSFQLGKLLFPVLHLGPHRGRLGHIIPFPRRTVSAGCLLYTSMIGENLLDVVEKKDDNRPNQVFAQISESRVGRCVRTADYLYSVYAPGVNGGEAAACLLYTSSPQWSQNYIQTAAHNPEVGGSSPPPATNKPLKSHDFSGFLHFSSLF